MADTLTSSVKVAFSGSLVSTLTNSLATPSALVEATISLAFSDGTAANKADKLWASKDRSLSGATAEDIDLYDLGSIDIGAGAGKDPLGQALALAEVAGIIVYNAATSVGTLTIGNKNATTAWNSWCNGSDTAAVTLYPGGVFAICSPTDPAYAVADTSNHLLTMTSSDTLTYDVYVLGRSA